MSEAAVRVDRCLDAASLDRVHQALAVLWEKAPHVPSADRTLFEIAVLEVATNIVVHGGTATTSTIDLRASDADVRAEFRDDGDPAGIDVDAAGWPDDLSESGRGLPMTRAALHHFSHRRDGATNVWLLRRDLAGERARPR